MKLSVALATYNGEKYLLDQLQSIENQSLKPDELIISDDHSPDQTIRIIEEFMSKTSLNVKLFVHEENQGYSRNFSFALEQCIGDIIFLCDQDDVWLPNKIERMVQEFDAQPKIQLLIHDLELKAQEAKIGQVLQVKGRTFNPKFNTQIEWL